MAALEFFVASLQQSPDVHPPSLPLYSSFAGVEDVLLQSPRFTTLLLVFQVVILVSLVDGLGIDFWDWFLVFSAAIVCSAENMCDGMQWFCNPVWVSPARKLASKNKMADVWKM